MESARGEGGVDVVTAAIAPLVISQQGVIYLALNADT